MLIFIIAVHEISAYTGYRRSIDGVLEAGNAMTTAMNKSNSNDHSSDVDVDNHTLTSTATIITQNTSSQDQTPPKHAQQLENSNVNFIKNEQQAQQQPPQPAPRTRSFSSQNSIPMTNGTNGDSAKADDAAQVRILTFLLIVSRFFNYGLR